jgi:hypothetical protein
VADAAYRAGRGDLFREAFLVAWRAQPDAAAIPVYYAGLYNWARQLDQTATTTTRAQAAQILATAAQINRAAGLGQWEAEQELEIRFGADRVSWPVPLPGDPVLATIGNPRANL